MIHGQQKDKVVLPEKAGEALKIKDRELQDARRDTQSWMQRGMEAIHTNDELQAELMNHKAQSAEWEQRYKDLERSHYHSDKKPAVLLLLALRRFWWFLLHLIPSGLILGELPERAQVATRWGDLLRCRLLRCHWKVAEPVLVSRVRRPGLNLLYALRLQALQPTAPEPKRQRASALKAGPPSMLSGNGE